jgi:hypothetical protein
MIVMFSIVPHAKSSLSPRLKRNMHRSGVMPMPPANSAILSYCFISLENLFAYDHYYRSMRTVYLAAPLFSEAELDFNRKLRDEIKSAGFEVFLPQEDSNNIKDERTRQKIIFGKNKAAIQHSDLIVSVLDGTDVDSGTAWEIGYAYALGKPIIGLRTDFRTLGIEGVVNLMIELSVILCTNIPELMDRLENIQF